MSDLTQDAKAAESKVASIDATAKADVQKVETEVESFDARAEKAKQRAMAMLNAEEGWIERHPLIVTAIGVVLVAALVWLTVHELVH